MGVKVIVLDRDGVINHDSDQYIKSLAEWVPIDGSIDAIARLSQAGYRVFVATNQSGLARGYFDERTLDAMHQRLLDLVQEAGGEIEGIFYCPHGPEDQCRCRKPLPGLFEQIEQYLGAPLSGSPAVGDSLRDLQAASAVGAKPILVRTGKGERTLASGKGLENIPVFKDLSAVVDDLLSASEGQP